MKIINAFTLGMSLVLILPLFTSCKKDDPIPVVEKIGHIDTTMMIDVGGYDLYTETLGEGSATVVFESGLGDGYESWPDTLLNRLSNNHQTIVYSRAGYDPSDASNNDVPRDINQLAKELKVVLDTISQNDKVILVGHSIGGSIIRAFANLYSDKVEGIVFIDPQHESEYDENSIKEFEAILINTLPNVPPFIEVEKEVEQLYEDWVILSNLPALPDVPVAVLTAMSLNDDGEISTLEERQLLYEGQAKLGEGVTDFIHESSDLVGHYIHEQDPEWVINTILNIID